MVLSIEDEPSFSFGLPEELFTWDVVGGSYGYDVSPDGQRFVVNRQGASEEATLQIIVVQNWFEELNRLAPRPE